MLTVKNLVKTYHTKGGVVTKALDNVSVDFPETGMVFLLGKSGSGKSTLLNMIGGLDRPDGGEVIVKGKSSKDFTTQDFDSYRNTFIGFIFQEYNILNEFNVEQNIALALQLQGKKANNEAIAKLLKEVDLVGLEKRKPNTLSGGQKQRIAIARALIKEPQIIMADEPTGALDSNTGKQVFDTLKKLSANKLVIIVSHDREFAQQYGDRIIELKDGKIISDDSKVYQKAKKVSENVNLISGNIIQIKNATKLSAKDNKAIIETLKKQKGEVIISGGNNNLPNVKKALKINESGASETFDKTTKVDIKQYDGNQTKFIKSKMPFWRAFKIGASGLKVKPFRLIMTILLSTVSFGMFGVVSALMLYNANYSIREAMRNVDYKTETINKKFKYKNQTIKFDYNTRKESVSYTSDEITSKTLFTQDELNELNNNSTGLKFAGAFDFSNATYYNSPTFTIEGLNVNNTQKDYYPSSLISLANFSDCGEDYMNSQNFTNCPDGYYPSEANEIAVSNYIGDALLQTEKFKGKTHVKDLVGETIQVTGSTGSRHSFSKEMTITGVYHIADIPNTYDSLKEEINTSVQTPDERKKISEAFNSFINGGFFRTGFVSDKFYEACKDLVPSPSMESNVPTIYLRGIGFSTDYPSYMEVTGDYGYGAYDYDYVKDFSNFQYYDVISGEKVDKSKVELTDGEAIISESNYNELIRRPISLYGSVASQFSKIYDFVPYSNDYSDDLKTKINDINENQYQNFQKALNGYEGFFDEDAYNDFEVVKEFLDENFNDINLIRFGRDLHDIDIIGTIESEYQHIVSEPLYSLFKGTISKYNWSPEPEIIGETDIDNINNFVYEYIDEIKEIRKQLFLYIGNNLTVPLCVQFNNLAYGKDGSDGYYNILDQYRNDAIDESQFKIKTQELLNKIYVDPVDLNNKESYYPQNKSIFDPVYDYNAYYFYKTGTTDESVGTLSVKYFYKNSEQYRYEPIVNHNLVQSYIADTNIFYNKIITDYKMPEDAKYNNLITVSDYSDGQIDIMSRDYGTYLYEMNNTTYQNMTAMISLVNQFKQIFLYVGIGTGALAAVLLANFISASINNKKKDIGILRAVGAKSGDVFKVFWSESGIIALICFLLASIAAGIVCVVLNNILVGINIGTIAGIKILNFNIVNIGIILAAAVLISILATLFPVLRAAKKPPVEAIRSL